MLTHLRDKTTKPVLFRTLSYQISLLLALEATRDLATEEKSIETPMESMTGKVLARPRGHCADPARRSRHGAAVSG